jgi:hypothetical protein
MASTCTARHLQLGTWRRRLAELVARQASKPVVAQNHGVMWPQVLHQAHALGQVNGRAFEVVVADVTHKADRGLAYHRQQAGRCVLATAMPARGVGR